MERLQKVLANAGVASRRQCEAIIAEGRVTVNGQVITQMGVVVDPGKDKIRCDGRPVGVEKKVYYLLNKPKGYVVTQADEFGRKRAVDLLLGVQERVVAVGRLDRESEGLLIFTNDGELHNFLTHPRYEVPKVYLVEVNGVPGHSDIERLTRGMQFEDGIFRVDSAAVRFSSHESTSIELTLREGRNREIRRLLARLGYKVRTLKRIRIGTLTDRGLSIGRFRPLTQQEVKQLRHGDFSDVRARGKRRRQHTKRPERG